MNDKKYFKKQGRIISSTLLQSLYLLEVLYELSDGEGKTATLLEILIGNIRKTFRRTQKLIKLQ